MIYKLCAIILKSIEKREFNKVKDTLADIVEGKTHCYKLNKGDIITVTEKQFFNKYYKYLQWFAPIKREKHIVWYNPLTWFRWYWVLEVVNG